MDNNSGNGMKFGFDKSDANKDEQKIDETISTVEGGADNSKIASAVEIAPQEDVEEYTDNRSVTIMLVKNYSLYRKANDKVLPRRKDFIGSSIHSSRVLSSNKEEVDTYFPNIIGLSPSDPNFVMRVKQHLNNIRVPVDELGRTFNISFHYYHKKDYYQIKAEEDKIEKVYQTANRQDVKKLREALKEKITKLNILESSKCKLGYPINIDDYLMYRHCLLYNDVAKDIALINVDSNIRFYFKDDQKEAEKLRKYRMEVNKAKANYVACLADNVLFDAVYTQYCVLNNLPVISSLAENRLDREIKLDKFSANEPIKFNKIFNNKDVKLIATIEMLIARGELIRTQYNQNITSPDGDFIGANMSEAIAWFKNTENSSVVNAYINKLKNI
jgi:hypothetical protein|nr:MAG TPA: hypothetical protein [Crassvirales sp.]